MDFEMFNEILLTLPFDQKLVVIVLLAWGLIESLRHTCIWLCVPPEKGRKGRGYLHIVPSKTLFQSFCSPHVSVYALGKQTPEKDKGKVVLEAYYPCCVIMAIYLLSFLSCIIWFSFATLVIAICVGAIFPCFAMPLENQILKLGSKMVKKYYRL